MAVDMYLQIDGVKGESLDDKHKDWIEVLSYNHGMSMAVSAVKSNAGGASVGRTQHGDFSITKYVDLASPKLYEAVSKGKAFATVKFEMCRAGGNQVPYMTITLEEAIISRVMQNGPQNVSEGGATDDNPGIGVGRTPSSGLAVSNADVLPTETININYGKIHWKYTQQKRKDGSPGGNVETQYDLTANK